MVIPCGPAIARRKNACEVSAGNDLVLRRSALRQHGARLDVDRRGSNHPLQALCVQRGCTQREEYGATEESHRRKGLR